MYKKNQHCLSRTSQLKTSICAWKEKNINVAEALAVWIEFENQRINSSSTNNITRINIKNIDIKPNQWHHDTNTREIYQIEITQEISKAYRYNTISDAPSQTTCWEVHKRAGMIIITDIQNLRKNTNTKVALKFKLTEIDKKKRYSKNISAKWLSDVIWLR